MKLIGHSLKKVTGFCFGILGLFLALLSLGLIWATLGGIWGGVWGYKVKDTFTLVGTLWVPVIFGAIISIISTMMEDSIRTKHFGKTVAIAIGGAIPATLLCYGIYFVFAAFAILGNQIFQFAQLAEWTPYSSFHFLSAFQIESQWMYNPTNWIGIHKLIGFVPGSIFSLLIALTAWISFRYFRREMSEFFEGIFQSK